MTKHGEPLRNATSEVLHRAADLGHSEGYKCTVLCLPGGACIVTCLCRTWKSLQATCDIAPNAVRSASLIFAPCVMSAFLQGAAQREKSQGSLPAQGRPRKASRNKKALSSQLSSAFSLSQSQSAAVLVKLPCLRSSTPVMACPLCTTSMVCSACRGSMRLKS